MIIEAEISLYDALLRCRDLELVCALESEVFSVKIGRGWVQLEKVCVFGLNVSQVVVVNVEVRGDGGAFQGLGDLKVLASTRKSLDVARLSSPAVLVFARRFLRCLKHVVNIQALALPHQRCKMALVRALKRETIGVEILVSCLLEVVGIFAEAPTIL